MIVNELIAELLKMPPTAKVTTRAGEILSVSLEPDNDPDLEREINNVMLWD